MYFSTSTAANVLVVGNDSLYEEGDKYFVYVKTDSSDKEKREIKIGAQDDNYTEVKSGLSEEIWFIMILIQRSQVTIQHMRLSWELLRQQEPANPIRW